MIRSCNDKPALIGDQFKVSYRQLASRAIHFAAELPAQKGGKLAIFAENRPEWVYVLYGAWRRGLTVVPIDPMSTASEVAYVLDDCTPEFVICSAKTERVLREALPASSANTELITLEDRDWGDEECDEFPTMDPEQTAVIIYTSGTTGSPKGVMLSFQNILENVEAVSDRVQVYQESDRVLALLPFHHVYPLMGTIIAPIYTGATIVFARSLASNHVLAALQKFRVTFIVGVPRLFSVLHKGIMDKINARVLTRGMFLLAQKLGSRSVSRRLFKIVHERFGGHVRFLISGGAALDRQVAEDFVALGFEVLDGFGMSESAPMITFTRPGQWKSGSVGQSLPGTEIRIVDDEVVARGPQVMKGYYNRPEETAQVLRDGWLYTGDLGYLDDEGYLFITGRRKDIIVLPSGKNINPEEIEQKLTSLSDLLLEAGVFMDGNVLHLVALLDPERHDELGETDPETWVQQQLIDVYNERVSTYKRISTFTLADAMLPRTRLGKLRRFQLSGFATDVTRRRRVGAEPDTEVYHIIRRYLERETNLEVAPHHSLQHDLKLDSLGMLSLLVFLEKSFGLEMGEERLYKMADVADVAAWADEYKTMVREATVNWGEVLRETLDLRLPPKWFSHSLINTPARWFLQLYFRLRSEGRENLPDSPYILVANHQSILDGYLVTAFLKRFHRRRTWIYTRDVHLRRWWVRLLARWNNVIVLDLQHDLRRSLQKLAHVLKQGGNVLIFPEGTRSRDGNLRSFKKMFAILSREMNVPVVPVLIEGAGSALPAGGLVPRPWKKLSVRIMKPVYPEQHSYESLRDMVYQQISRKINP